MKANIVLPFAPKVGVIPDSDNKYGSGSIASMLPKRLLRQIDLPTGFGHKIDPVAWDHVALQVAKLWDQLPEVERAAAIISQITTRARMASAVGQSHATLSSVKSCDIEFPGGIKTFNYVEPEWLKGVAGKVWEHVVEKSRGFAVEYQPTLELWDYAAKDLGGHNIVIHFPPSSKVARSAEADLAKIIIAQIPLRSAMEAFVGRMHSAVMSISDGDTRYLDISHQVTSEAVKPINHQGASVKSFGPDYIPGTATPNSLRGAAKEVWDYLETNGLKPSLEYWENNSTPKNPQSGYNIVVHWQKFN